MLCARPGHRSFAAITSCCTEARLDWWPGGINWRACRNWRHGCNLNAQYATHRLIVGKKQHTAPHSCFTWRQQRRSKHYCDFVNTVLWHILRVSYLKFLAKSWYVVYASVSHVPECCTACGFCLCVLCQPFLCFLSPQVYIHIHIIYINIINKKIYTIYFKCELVCAAASLFFGGHSRHYMLPPAHLKRQCSCSASPCTFHIGLLAVSQGRHLAAVKTGVQPSFHSLICGGYFMTSFCVCVWLPWIGLQFHFCGSSVISEVHETDWFWCCLHREIAELIKVFLCLW